MTDTYGQSIYAYEGYASKTVKWVPADTEDRFKDHMSRPDKRKILFDNLWNSRTINYTFNKDGFRSEEFIDSINDSIVFLGCSLTMGIGMALEDSWTYKVARSFKLRRYNLGIGGGSADTCFRLAHHWVPILKPKYVVMLIPPPGRFEVLKSNGISQYSVQSTELHIVNFIQEWISSSANTKLNYTKNILAISAICKDLNIPFFVKDIRDTGNEFVDPNNEWARDLMHPGIQWNESVSASFIGEIKQWEEQQHI